MDGCRFSPVYDELDTGVFADAKAALGWAETERANLLAAQQAAAGHRATEVGDPWLQSGALSARTAPTVRPTTRTPSCRTLNGPWASRRR